MNRSDSRLDDPTELAHSPHPAPQPTIALLHCYDLIEDFLATLNLSFEDFCQTFMGSWMFGYIHALQQVGVSVVLFCISAQVQTPTEFRHHPTGATLCVLPPTRLYRGYRKFRERSLQLYGAETGQSFKDVQQNTQKNVQRDIRKNSQSNIQHQKSLVQAGLTQAKDLLKSLGTYSCLPLGLLAQELRRYRCQAMLCQEYEYARFDTCVLLGKRLNMPVFATFQGGDSTQSWLEVPCRWIALQHCAGLIIPSQREIERVQQHYPMVKERIAKVLNPFEPQAWVTADPVERSQLRHQLRQQFGLSEEAQVVIWHGRVEIERKGLDVLLEAWRQVCQERPMADLQLLLVGTGSDAERLQQSLAANPLTNIHWLNQFISDRTILRQYLTAADLYGFPSRQEGFPLAPLEAMAAGLPIVAADAPGVPDLLQLGESGSRMVPRGDVAAFANALGWMVDHPEARAALGMQAQQYVIRHFSPATIGQQLKAVLLPNSQFNQR